VTSVLSGAPRAALWGPAPIVRASGRCLDVVRILRMTPGARHVEASALRCQAVLEAMRGRGDAARAILAGCRATFEELGLALELHETAVFAGIVELLGDDPAAAEAELRTAQDGFLALGVDGGAAQSAALLARALLEQDRDDEALEATRFAEDRGGEDLKTTIAWLGARAEALARRGAIDEALPLAERAASLAEPTDALADKADALMALARVRRAAGQADGAREVAEEACTLYAEKNHAVGVTRAAGLAGAEEPPLEPAESPAAAVEGVPHSEPTRAFLDAHARRDWEALGSLFADDYVLVDHRQIGWDTEMFSGADQMLEQQRSIPDAGIEYVVVGRLVRAEPGVEAGLLAWSGPGWAFEFGVVSRLRDGLFASGDIFEPDDRAGMMRRFEELICERDLEEMPVGRAQLAVLHAFNRRDWERVRDGFHQDFTHHEHRQFGWDVHDRDGVVAMLESWPEMVPDARMFVSRLEADTEHLMALVYGGVGTADGGELELLLAAVLEERGGRIVRQEAFDPDDRDGLVRRFDELRRERELEQTPAGRLHLEYLRANNARDWEAFARLHSDDFVWVEHRALGWDLSSPAEAVDLLKSWTEISPDGRLSSPKLYGHTEHLLAGVFVGGGSAEGTDWEVAVGFVREERDGLLVRAEAFEPDDREGIVRRFEQLAAERELESTPAGRAYLAYLRTNNERDWEALRGLYSDDFAMADHRGIDEWGIETADEVVASMKAWAEMSPDGRLGHVEVLAQDEHVIAAVMSGSGSVDGAAFEIESPFVAAVRAGRIARLEVFKADDRAGALASYERLRSPAAAAIERYMDAMRRRDRAALVACFTPGYRLVDRRQVGWGELDRDALVATSASVFELGDFHGTLRTLGADGDAVAQVITWAGTSNEGAAWENPLAALNIGHDALAYCEIFEPDDEEGLLARFAELTANGVRPVHPLARVLVERGVRAFNERRWDDLRAMLADEFAGRDLRPLSQAEITGPDEFVELLQTGIGVAPALRMHPELLAGEELPGALLISAAITTLHADATAAVGANELPTGNVRVSHDGLMTRIDVLDGDAEAVLAHYDAVKAELSGSDAQAVVQAVIDSYNARDLDATMEHFDEDVVWHTTPGFLWPGPYRGRDAVRGLFEHWWQGWSVGRVDPTQFEAEGRRVMLSADVHGRSAGDGSDVHVALNWVFYVREGLIELVRSFESPAEARAEL
jgi:ketosteroid isomerase-like protein